MNFSLKFFSYWSNFNIYKSNNSKPSQFPLYIILRFSFQLITFFLCILLFMINSLNVPQHMIVSKFLILKTYYIYLSISLYLGL